MNKEELEGWFLMELNMEEVVERRGVRMRRYLMEKIL